MHLRWRTVVVTGAGGVVGREVALRFARAGAGVVVVDGDAVALRETAGLVRARRVGTWTVQADVADGDDLALLAARLRDLGGADVVVHPDESWPAAPVLRVLVDALGDRPGESGAVVLVGPGDVALPSYDGAERPGGRVMGVATGATATPERVAAAVLDLVVRGADGDLVRP